MGFPGSSGVKNQPVNVEDASFIPGLGRLPGGGNGNPLPIFLPEKSHVLRPGRLQSMGSQRVGHN